VAAVVGAGAFGSNHARVYHELQTQGEPVRLAAVVDADLERAKAVAAKHGAQAFGSVRELLAAEKVDAASVAVPTIRHLEVARELMAAGVDVLIEKPLSATLEQADELIRTARQNGRIAQTGHLERFNPAVRATIPLVTRPMFFEVHRLSTFGPRALDVDVVLDLMIHDLDIVLSMVDSPVKEVRAVGLPILSDKVDIANVRMEFENGCVANFTASRVSTERVRKLRFFQPRQYISVDYTRQDVLVITVRGENGDPRTGVHEAEEFERKTAGLPPPVGFDISKPQVSQEEPLKAELKSFLEAVRQRTRPMVTLEEGRRALAAALEILGAIRVHAKRAGLAADERR
jgi:predicted dehydrogenase